MKILQDILNNHAIWAALTAWFTAQLLKWIVYIVREKKFSPKMLFSSGGMPSSHSATVCAMVTVIAAECGFASPEFAIAFVFAYIVMYDAVGVRQEVGKHARIINSIMEDFDRGDDETAFKELKELIGHSLMQVVVGALYGIAIGLLFYRLNH